MLARNVLIFHAGALGDFVLTWPLALALGRLYAQSRIVYVTAAGKGQLAERVLRIESVDIESGWHVLHGESPQLPPRPQQLLAGAHTVIHFAASVDERWTANVRAIAQRADIIWLHPNPPERSGVHATRHVLAQLAEHRLIGPALEQMLRSIDDRGIGLARTPGDEIVIHPGAGSPAKCWPAERFAALIARLRDDGHAVKVLIGEVERERWPAGQIEPLAAVATSVVTPQTLLDLFLHLSEAKLVIANDSGPAHLAAIAGVPTFALFGASDPQRWRPIGPNVHVLRHDLLEDLSEQRVHEAVLSTLHSCKPPPPAR
jgi:heptosyltransferase III